MTEEKIPNPEISEESTPTEGTEESTEGETKNKEAPKEQNSQEEQSLVWRVLRHPCTLTLIGMAGIVYASAKGFNSCVQREVSRKYSNKTEAAESAKSGEKLQYAQYEQLIKDLEVTNDALIKERNGLAKKVKDAEAAEKAKEAKTSTAPQKNKVPEQTATQSGNFNNNRITISCSTNSTNEETSHSHAVRASTHPTAHSHEREYTLRDLGHDYRRAISNLEHERDSCTREIAKLNHNQGRAISRIVGSSLDLVVDGMRYSDYNTRHSHGRHNYSAVRSASREIENMVYDGHNFNTAAEAKEYLQEKAKEISEELTRVQALYQDSLNQNKVIPDARTAVETNLHRKR